MTATIPARRWRTLALFPIDLLKILNNWRRCTYPDISMSSDSIYRETPQSEIDISLYPSDVDQNRDPPASTLINLLNWINRKISISIPHLGR